MQRHGRAAAAAAGFCGWGCERGSYLGWWDTVRRHCTCDQNWGERCCRTYTGPCYVNNPALCDQSRLSEKSFAVRDLLKDGVYNGPLTLGTAADNLPPNMQGVFWLQDQAGSSSIVSFGPSRDGDGLSVWNADSDRQVSIRVGGDRVWSGASNGSTWELVEGIDLVYHFEGTPTANPTHFNIIPEAMNLGGLELSGDLAEWALSFQMDLLPLGDPNHEYPATAARPAAVQWARTSSFAGVEASVGNYEIAQVIDGTGMPTAAFDAWVAYNSGDEEWQDGTIYYRSA